MANALAIFDRLGEATKAISSRKVKFGDINANGYGLPSFGLNGWGNSYTIGNSPGANHDYSTMIGDPLQNRVVAACINAKATALATAPSILEQKKGKDWQPIDHPIVDLLNNPNAYKSGFELWDATCAAEDTQGQVFWRLEFDKSGVPGEIWVDHPDRYTVLGDHENYISGYRYQTESSGNVVLEDKEVIHIRRFANLRNGRIGWAPLSAGARQVSGDNAAATYHTAILRNSGVMSLLISVKEGLQAGQGMTPDQMQTFVTAIKSKLFGEGAGGIVGQNLPLDVKNMSFTPDELMVDKLIAYYEYTICSLLGVDPMVIGLGSGTMQKTYANMGEALQDFWQRTIKPTATRYNAILNTQLLPLFGLDPAEYRLNRDYREVSAMQEDEDGRHVRVREDYKAGLYDLFTAQQALGLTPTPDMKGVMYTPPAKPGGDPGADPAAPVPPVEKKGWDEAAHPRDDDGKFGSGGTFKYGLSLRPPGVGNIPAGMVQDSHKPHPDFRHGTVEYPRQLTPDEMRSFELVEVGDDAHRSVSDNIVNRAQSSEYVADFVDGWHGKSEADKQEDVQSLIEIVTDNATDEAPHLSASLNRASKDEATVHRVRAILDHAAGPTKSIKLWNEADHPRADDGKFGTGSGGHVIGQTMQAALSKQNLSDQKKAAYSDTARAAMAGMTHSNLRTLGENVKAVKFYPDEQALDEHLSTSLDHPDGTFGGGYDANNGTVHLDGGDDAQGVYAHALSHALDVKADGERISDSPEWQEAWKDELSGSDSISRHAASNPADGFAEFGRLLFGGYQSEAQTRREYPKSYGVWQANGLREGGTKSLEIKYDPRQPRDDLGKWTEGTGGRLSVGHAAHVMRSEGISDEQAAGVLDKIKDGTHATREQVLAHIDSIHKMNNTTPPAEPTHQDKLVAAGDGSITPAQRSYLQQVHDDFHEVDAPGKQSTIIKANTAANLFGGKDSKVFRDLVPEYSKMGAVSEDGPSQRVQYLADLHDELVKKYVGGPLSSAQIDNLGKSQASELIDMYKQGGLRQAMSAHLGDSYAQGGIVGAGAQFGSDEKARKTVRDFTEAWVKKNPLPEKKSIGAGS